MSDETTLMVMAAIIYAGQDKGDKNTNQAIQAAVQIQTAVRKQRKAPTPAKR